MEGSAILMEVWRGACHVGARNGVSTKKCHLNMESDKPFGFIKEVPSF
jgi:hypothetical protein